MSDGTHTPVDPYAYIYFSRNSDGSLSRLPLPVPKIPATHDSNPSSSVLTKDFSINQSNNTWLRLFLPHQLLDSNKKLPLIVYYHGGGFVMSLGVSSAPFHNFCSTLAVGIPAVIASVEYRLAPEHRLPAAYEDAVEALHWIKTSVTEEEWFTKYVDLSNCYLMGSSAGANIAYHAGLHATAVVGELEPFKVRGLILHHPFFGGNQRTETELRLANDEVVPLSVNDLMWELALPVGADRDHEYSNPTVKNSGESDVWDKIRVLGWKVGVTGCDGDPVVERQMGFVNMVEEKGVKVMKLFSEGGYHAVELRDPSKAALFVAFVQQFMSSAPAN